MRSLCTITCALLTATLIVGCSQQKADVSTAAGDAADAMKKAGGDAAEAVEKAADDVKAAAKDVAEVVIPEGMTEIKSSAMKAVQYDADKKSLEILFPNGDTYSYEGVSQELYDGLVKAKSAGKYYAENLKGKLGEAKK